MKNIEDIDKLIKDGLDDFNPPAPDGVWEGIAEQIQSAPASPANPLVQRFLDLGIAAKASILVSIPVIMGGIFYLVQTETPQKAISQTVITQPQETIITPPAQVQTENTLTIPEPKAASNKVTIANQESKETAQPMVAEPSPAEVLPVDPPTPAQKIEPKNNPNPVVTDPKKADPAQILPIYSTDNKTENTNPSSKHNDPEFGNAFSPDGDGKNDVWEIHIEPTVFYHLKIFNVKGQLVFETETAGHFWNGSDSRTGVECDNGVYTYIFDYQFDKSEPILSKKGFINLYR